MVENKMQEIEIEKMVLNCGGTDDKLAKSVKLLEKITGKKVLINKSTKRIPAFAISPGKESGCKVTLRDKEKINDLLQRFFAAESNEIKGKQIVENQFSLGIPEYIEVPGLEYDRDIGILGLEITVVFKRKGKRVKIRKIKRGKYPQKQYVSKEEIIEFLNKNFGVEINDSK
jgi:large subunit ribosomal protein L5